MKLVAAIIGMVGTWLILGIVLGCLDDAVFNLIMACNIAGLLGAGVYRLCRPLLKKRASMWFSGAVAAVFMLAAGVAYGLWKQ